MRGTSITPLTSRTCITPLASRTSRTFTAFTTFTTFTFTMFTACMTFLTSAASVASARDDPGQLLAELVHPDPFVSERAEAEIRRLGSDVLPVLARAMDSPETGFRLRVDRLFTGLIETFFLELENDYRALALDRRELSVLREREKARVDLERLRKDVGEWRKAQPDLERKLEQVIAFRAIEKRRQTSPETPLDPATEQRYQDLKRAAEDIEKQIPDLEEKVRDLLRYYQLESISESLADRKEVEKLRAQDLEERVTERQPAVDALIGELTALGTPASSAMVARRTHLPLRDMAAERDLRSPVQVLYDRLLRETLEKSGDEYVQVDDETFERKRYQLALLWALQIDTSSPHEEEAQKLLERHLEATLGDLDRPARLLRERAALELFRLGNRGLEALLSSLGVEDAVDIEVDAGRRAFLANLLRWRISPLTYQRVGIHFGDYRSLPFTARRRKIFQYGRAAGQAAIPTLRAIVVDDTLESSFLVKYAAAKALSAQLDDRLGYVVLKSLYPEMLMKRPEISRDLRIIQGEKFMESKDYTRAVEEFSKILDELPFDFEGNYRIALAYLLLKNYAKSIHHFEIARRINPNDRLTLYNLACAYSLAGKSKEALEALRESVEAGFDDVEHMKKDPDLDPIRKLPLFAEILEKAGAAGK